MKRPLIALLLMLPLCMAAQTKMTRYLFAYFNNNTTEGQQVCYAVSSDGVNFTPLNDGLPVIASDTISRSGGVRDPHILRGADGWFYQVLTDMDMSLGKWTCQGIVMLRSRDLVSWQHHDVHFPERYKGTRFANVNAVWAPQTIYDPSAKKLMVYFSLHSDKDGPFPQDAVYYAYANADFSSLEGEPQPLFTYPHPTIDTDIVQDSNGLCHLFFNTWGGPDGLQRRQYELRDLHNQQTWTLVPGHQQPTSLNSEGSTAYQLLDGTWMLGYDCFKDGVYQFCRTSDFRHYELVHETKTVGNFTPRHGSILQISEQEYQHLLKSYGKVFRAGPEYMPAEMEPIAAPFDVSGISRPVFAGRTATVKMNKRGLSTRQVQTAIDRMSRQGGGTVVIPSGQWTSGRIELKSGVCLHLSEGAVLTFSGYVKDYQPAVPTRSEGYDVMSLGAMIYANGAENIGLTGRGHIVGPSTDCEIYQENRKYLVVEECVDIAKPIGERLCDGQQGRPVLLPMTVAPVNCKNVLIEGITIDRGLFWNIVPQYCDNVIIRGVTVNSAGHGRTDGIDIESTTNSLIEYCQLDCGDDCYTIKSGRGEDGVRTARPSVGCVIRHSVALRGGGGLVLGSETAASMWNIYMHDCRFEGTEQGIRIKTRRPRGGGAHDVWVERVAAKDIKWNALTVDMLGSKKWVGELANRFPAREVNELTPEFKNIYIKHFTVDGCQRLIDVKALPERPLTNVLIENFQGRGKDFMRLQDVSGFVMKGCTIIVPEPAAMLDGCQGVALVGMDYGGKQLKQTLKNATIYQPEQRERLWQAFLTPPDSIRVGCYYYWVNEQVDPEGVRKDLEWMKHNGITLAFLATDIRNRTRWERPWEGETFGKNKFRSRLWWKNLRTALATAGELGIEMGLFNCPGWSQSGGPWVRPQEAMRDWTPQGIRICQTKQGHDVMCGPCSDEAEGLEVDKLSSRHVQRHFEAFIGDILRRVPASERPTLTTVVIDSWERGKQNYTDSIYSLFQQRYGYRLDYEDEKCRKDLDRLISDLVATEYMGALTEKAHEYGLRTWCEPYAHSPFPGNSITYGCQADEVAAEFWVNDRKYRRKEVDAALGAARASGKNRVWAESFTDGAWDKVAQDDWSFEKLKPLADRYFHAGINATILHVVISQPGDDSKPAVRPWFGTFFDRRSKNAKELKPLVDYLRRCNFMLQLGKPCNGANDCRILPDGTKIRFTEQSLFEVAFPDGSVEYWNPELRLSVS